MIGAAATIKGVEIWVRDIANQPESAKVIEKAFQSADIDFTVIGNAPDAPRSAYVPTPQFEFQINTGPE